MKQFLGTHQNRLDAKGRVSIPATFRATLRKLGESEGEAAGLVLRPSHKFACIEGWPEPTFDRLAATIEQMQTFSEEHDVMTWSVFGDAYAVEPDREGRIVLPESMAEYAGLQSAVSFVGQGGYFQIWEPAAAAAQKKTSNDLARSRGLSLPALAMAGRA